MAVLVLLLWYGRPPVSAAIEATVSISNYAYRPPTIMIAAGQTVTWSQQDVEQHSVTACAAARCPTVSSLSFDSRPLTQGQTFRLTFASPGTYPYYCTVHTYAIMHGTVVVTPVTSSPVTAPSQTVAAPLRSSPVTAPSPTVGAATPGPSPTPTVPRSSQPASHSPGAAVLGPSGTTPAGKPEVTGPPSGTTQNGSAAILVALIALGLGALTIAVGLSGQPGRAGKD